MVKLIFVFLFLILSSAAHAKSYVVYSSGEYEESRSHIQVVAWCKGRLELTFNLDDESFYKAGEVFLELQKLPTADKIYPTISYNFNVTERATWFEKSIETSGYIDLNLFIAGQIDYQVLVLCQ